MKIGKNSLRKLPDPVWKNCIGKQKFRKAKKTMTKYSM